MASRPAGENDDEVPFSEDAMADEEGLGGGDQRARWVEICSTRGPAAGGADVGTDILAAGGDL